LCQRITLIGNWFVDEAKSKKGAVAGKRRRPPSIFAELIEKSQQNKSQMFGFKILLFFLLAKATGNFGNIGSFLSTS
jgi:hypothetical protein